MRRTGRGEPVGGGCECPAWKPVSATRRSSGSARSISHAPRSNPSARSPRTSRSRSRVCGTGCPRSTPTRAPRIRRGCPATRNVNSPSCARRPADLRWGMRSQACGRVLRPGERSPKVVFPLVRELADDGFDVAVTCRVLGVRRQGYYEWRSGVKSLRAQENELLVKHIEKIHHKSRQTYGWPRVHAELTLGLGMRVNHKRVARLALTRSGAPTTPNTPLERGRSTARRSSTRSPGKSWVGPSMTTCAPNSSSTPSVWPSSGDSRNDYPPFCSGEDWSTPASFRRWALGQAQSRAAGPTWTSAMSNCWSRKARQAS